MSPEIAPGVYRYAPDDVCTCLREQFHGEVMTLMVSETCPIHGKITPSAPLEAVLRKAIEGAVSAAPLGVEGQETKDV